MTGQPSIGDYAFVSDCTSAALVSRAGSVDWWCAPRFDSPAVFSRLLDPDAGHWSIGPKGESRVRRDYVEGTLVVRTVFETRSGSVALTDGLAMAPGVRGHDIGMRSPGRLLRVVEGLSGDVDVAVEFAPRPEYGLTAPHLAGDALRLVARAGPVALHLTAPVPLQVDGAVARATVRVRAGERVGFTLAHVPAFDAEPPVPSDAVVSLADTVEAWRSWSRLHDAYDGFERSLVRRSALVLQGLTYARSGAVVAAATTSLPEQLGGSANWDYRFAWLRDVSLTMRAQWVAACPQEANRFFAWIATAMGDFGEQPLQIMYGVAGERDLTEHVLDHLAGYRDSRPVRIGNDAWRQRQLDVLGEVLDAAHLLADRLEFDERVRTLLVAIADQAASDWREPDAGMWEARDRDRHYTSSKVMCWVALDRAIALSDRLGDGAHVERWRAERDAIHEAVCEHAYNGDIGAFAGAFGSDRLDASVLLLPLVGFLPADEPRMRSTIDAIADRLGSSGLVYRWDGDSNPFVLTTYWLAECYARAGDVDRAVETFRRATSCANDLGLLSEEADPDGEQVGNVPQAFSHVGLVNAAWAITRAGRTS